MKAIVNDPFTSVQETGGCTFEPACGWWTQVRSPTQAGVLGDPFEDRRFAIYIPTIQKTGDPVDEGLVTEFKTRAQELGLTEITRAAGMWVLSETSEVQTETIWIAYSGDSEISVEQQVKISELAWVVRDLGNQDCVAWENGGLLHFTDEPPTIPETTSSSTKFKEVKTMTKRIWIVPRNDLEAVVIINLLKRVGETVVESQQPWGASWEGLEADVLASIQTLLAESPHAEVIGVELMGEPKYGGRTLDPHRYGGREETVSNDTTALETVAELLQVQLNRYEKLVAANDKGWIPGLREAGAREGELEAVRMADRCAQGVTPDDEAKAVEAIQEAQWRGRKVFVQTDLSSWKLSPISDRLYGKSDERLIAASNAWLYDGTRHREIFNLVHDRGLGRKNDWVGGRAESGYAGFIDPAEETRRIITEFFWKEENI